jgi:hypothetical protein
MHVFITNHQTWVTKLPSYKQMQHFHHKKERQEEIEGKSENMRKEENRVSQ